MRKLLLLAMAVAGLATPAARAADAPTVTVQVQSVDDLLDYAEYLGGLVGQTEQMKQGVQFVRGIIDPKKGLEGIDAVRPIGAYGVLGPNVVDSTAVVVLPIADEEALLDLLTGRLAIDPKKGADGVYELNAPNVSETIYFRFANKSAYVTIRSAKPLDKDALIDPKDLFDVKDESVASVRVNLDRVPKNVRETVIGQLELQLAQKKAVPAESPAQGKLRNLLLDTATDVIATVLGDGKQLTVRFDIDPKTDELTADLALTGKPGTPLAEFLKSTGSATGLPPLGGKSAVMSGGLRLSLPSEYRSKLNAAIDDAMKEAIAKAKETERGVVKLVLNAVAPTLKSGELDVAAAITADGGKPRFVLGLRVKEGTGIETTIKQFAPFIPESKGKIDFDADKVNGVKLHKVQSDDQNLKKTFGTDTAWIGISDTLLLIGVDPDGDLVRAAAKADAAKVPVVSAEMSVAGALPLFEKMLSPAKQKELVADAFPNGPVGKDTFALSLTGGDALTLKVTLKGSAVKLAAAVDKAKKQ